VGVLLVLGLTWSLLRSTPPPEASVPPAMPAPAPVPSIAKPAAPAVPEIAPPPAGPTPYEQAIAAARQAQARGTADGIDSALLAASRALQLAQGEAERALAQGLLEEIQGARQKLQAEDEYGKWLSRGREALARGEYEQAISMLTLAAKVRDSKEVQALLVDARTRKAEAETQTEYARLLAQGQEALKAKEPEAAIASLQAAQKLQDSADVRRLLGEAQALRAQQEREREYARWVQIGQKAMERKLYSDAVFALGKAREVRDTEEVRRLLALAEAEQKLAAAQAAPVPQPQTQPQPRPKPPSPTPTPPKPVPAPVARRSIAEANAVFDEAEHEREVGIRSLLRKHAQYMKAAELYQKVIDTWPASDKIEACHYWRGLVFQTLMKYPEAVPEYQAVLRVNPEPEFVDVYFRLAEIHDKQFQKYAEAKRWYKLAAEKDKYDKFRADAEKRVQELAEQGY